MNKIFNQIGLAYAAKKVVFGTDNIVDAMKKNRLQLVVLGSSASIATQKLVQDKAKTYGVDVLLVLEDDNKSIAHALGKKQVKVIGVKDSGFKKMMTKS